jgi:hypothetical protein
VGVTRRAHVDEIDVVALDQHAMIHRHGRNGEAVRRRTGQFSLRIGNGDDLASIIATETRKMGDGGPDAGAQDTDPQSTARHECWRS